MPVSIEIVLPCYNPNEIWHKELLDFYNNVKSTYDVNFIVVNDGSFASNVSEQINYLRENNIPINYISYKKNRGKGYALRQGVTLSTSQFVVYTDIDFPFTNQSTKDLINCLVTQNYDVVVGYRAENYYQKEMTGFRKILSKAFRGFTKNILKMPVSDTQCGLKGFNKVGKEKFLTTTIDRYLFDFEFIYYAGKDKNLKIKPIQVELKDNVVFSKMKFKIIMQEGFNLLRILIFGKN